MPFPAIFGTIAQAAIPALVSGLLQKKQKTDATRGSVDYAAMREAAERAGFNPLTALRAGGGAGFQVTHHPALASPNFLGQALHDGLQAGFSYDPNDGRRERLEMEIMEAQLKRLNEGERADYGLDPLVATAPNVQRYDGAPMTPEVQAPKVTNPTRWFAVDPNAADTEQFEDRYGDLIGGLIGGTTRLVADGYENFMRADRWVANKIRGWMGMPKLPPWRQ